METLPKCEVKSSDHDRSVPAYWPQTRRVAGQKVKTMKLPTVFGFFIVISLMSQITVSQSNRIQPVSHFAAATSFLTSPAWPENPLSSLLNNRPGSFLKFAFPQLFQMLQRADDIRKTGEESVRAATICRVCKAGLRIFVDFTRALPNPRSVLHVFFFTCKWYRNYSDAFCNEIKDSFGEHFVFMMVNGDRSLSNKFCSILLQPLGCESDDPKGIDWNVRINRTLPAVQQSVGNNSFDIEHYASASTKVLHLTDIHLDLDYVPGSLAECTGILCCRGQKLSEETNQALGAGFYGDYRNCDLPYHTFESALSHIATSHPDIDIIYLTGDFIPHIEFGDDFGRAEFVKLVHNCTQTIVKYFPNTTVVPTLGNHDTLPAFQFTPTRVPLKISTDWLYKSLGEVWTQSGWLLESEARGTFNRGGFFDREVSPGFRIVVLNTNLCYTFNFWQAFEDEDPFGQLQWLSDVLGKAEKLGQKVHILGHIPPSLSECWHVWSKNYYNIITRYHLTVTGQFFGHTHFDEFALYYHPTNKSEATNGVFLGASLTPHTNLNPGYKIYSVDGARGEESTYKIIDHETWIFNLTEANLNPKKPPQWFKLYKATEAYDIPNVFPESLHLFVQKLASNTTIFEKYLRNFYKVADVPQQLICDTSCHKEFICNIVSYNFNNLADCLLADQLWGGQIS
ncbi:unnamed protein product [Allacma fusca]|uniref:Sphingomyelin phosphodiesterase n=1 Tax=Allacma fusca TaxID=39272 RepID=A0A8J2KAU2_9HEXA|nr:unnamed protein product [Allacma fusca]